jgi:hypothetical protein
MGYSLRKMNYYQWGIRYYLLKKSTDCRAGISSADVNEFLKNRKAFSILDEGFLFLLGLFTI